MGGLVRGWRRHSAWMPVASANERQSVPFRLVIRHGVIVEFAGGPHCLLAIPDLG